MKAADLAYYSALSTDPVKSTFLGIHAFFAMSAFNKCCCNFDQFFGVTAFQTWWHF